jgi:hypothetical protein
LEAAPSNWNGPSGDPQSVWSDNFNLLGTSTSIGTGLANSNLITANVTVTTAALLCRNYAGGGLTDWFLPSHDELNALCTNSSIVGLNSSSYWSSSEVTNNHAYGLSATFSFIQAKIISNYARPIRAF